MCLRIHFYGLKQLKSYELFELIPDGLSRDKGILSLMNKTQAHAE
jgi:hypothetical protein